MQNDLRNKIARVYCSGCTLYVEKSKSCCYIDGSGRDKYCPSVLSKADQIIKIIPKYVQVFNPKSKRWILVDKVNGKILGNSKNKYEVPVATKNNKDVV